LIMLAGIEIVLHAAGPAVLVSYEQGLASRFTTRHHVLANGVSDICFLGSSRTNNGITCPTVIEVLRDDGMDTLSVSNYSAGGAQVPELVPLARFLLRHGRPELLLFGVEAEQLATGEDVNERSAVFWNCEDLMRTRLRLGADVDRYIFQVVQNSAEDYLYLLRCRGRPGNLLRELGRSEPVPHPIRGEMLAPSHTRDARTTLKVTSETFSDVREHVSETHLVDGKFPFSSLRLQLVKELIRMCDAAQVPIVFFELPDADCYRAAFPGGTQHRFRQQFRRLVRGSRMASFVTFEELELEFGNDEFRDPVHLNLAGARKLSRRVTERVILPRLGQ